MNIVTRRHWHKKTVYLKEYESPALLDLIENIDQLSCPVHYLKEGDTTTVMRVEVNDKTWVIKKYNLINMWSRIKRALTLSRAARSWRFSFLLRCLEIKTPSPIAFIENAWGPFRKESYFISEYIPGVTALDYFSKFTSKEEEMIVMANKLLRQIKLLFQAGVTYGDMKASNFIINPEGVFFVDLEGMRRYKNSFLFKRAKMRDIKRFKKNWKEMPLCQEIFFSLT